MKILICVNRRCDPDLSAAEKLTSFLAERGAQVRIVIPFDMNDPGERSAAVKGNDLVITLGGDGTVLKMAPAAAAEGVPLMGINRGRLGYLTEIELSEISLLEKLFTELKTERRMMLKATLIRGGQAVSSCTALNDVLIRPQAVHKTARIITEVDSSPLMDYIGDGIMASTPTGSTGYSYSAGGMIADPSLSCILVTPLLAHSAFSRGHILSDRRVVRFTVMKPENVLIIDGSVWLPLEENDIVQVEKSEKDLCLAKITGTDLNEGYRIRNL